MKEYLPQIIASAIVLLLLPLTRFVANKIILQSSRFIQMPLPRVLQVKQIISIIINITFVIALAVVWGVRAENLVIALSSIFAVIGVAFFAQWSILSNVTAGIIMFFTAPYRVGDYIRIIDKDIPIDAIIENIHAFYTHVRTDKDELIVIPNNQFLQKAVLIKKVDGA